MPTLTPAERRGALLLVALLVLGTLRDLGRAVWPGRTRPLTTALEAGPPPADPPGAPGAAGRAGRGADARGAPLDLNRAGVADLDALPGIGPVLAKRIVEHRLAHGPFHAPEDLLAVRGIGPRLYARIEPLVTVAGAAGAGPPRGAAGGR